MAKVYVTQEQDKRDITGALQYGEIEILFAPADLDSWIIGMSIARPSIQKRLFIPPVTKYVLWKS